jgi:hypothetical protein
MRILGWLITGFAISFGAPFWFDLLNRMMVIRSTVKPHEKSPEEASQDKQSDKEKSKSQPTSTVIVATGTAAAPTTTHSASGAAIDAGDDYKGHEWSSGFPEAGVL